MRNSLLPPLARSVLLVAIACLPGLEASAAEKPAKLAQCVACHGMDGLSKLPNAPHLAGQPEMYLVKSLEAYRSGERKDEMMGVIAKPLKDSDIEALAAWFSAIEVTATVPK